MGKLRQWIMCGFKVGIMCWFRVGIIGRFGEMILIGLEWLSWFS